MMLQPIFSKIVALRNEKGSYNQVSCKSCSAIIVALRNEKGSYNGFFCDERIFFIVALRNEKGSYNTLLKKGNPI